MRDAAPQVLDAMGPLRAACERLRRRGRKALIPFVMGGDPSLRITAELLLALEAAGADVLEVGIPFSDPLADGPVIQAASARALAAGATPAGVLRAVASVRRRLHVPVVALIYWNLVLQFAGGTSRAVEQFLEAARASGLSGLIVPDLPAEAAEALRQAAVRHGMAVVGLAAPTSPPERLRLIARASQGFIYYVAVTGTTGMRRRLSPGLLAGVRQLRLLTTKPIYVGFGISSPAQAVAVARVADGVIVGSALIAAMHRAQGRASALRAAARFVTRMRSAID